ncbi:MAG TPA: hypothetical protein EYP95_00990 [Nitrospinaceae bacterium]|nr:hypothetical protein [Nitrospinaceae bacterium]
MLLVNNNSCFVGPELDQATVKVNLMYVVIDGFLVCIAIPANFITIVTLVKNRKEMGNVCNATTLLNSIVSLFSILVFLVTNMAQFPGKKYLF